MKDNNDSTSDGYERLLNVDPNSIAWFPTIGLKLTGACALKCEFCCEPDRLSQVADLETFKDIADRLWSAGTRRLCLTGGDPLLYPYLSPLLEYTYSKGFYNLLLTADGPLLQRKLPSISEFVHGVRLSIHGIGYKNDTAVGRNGAFTGIEACAKLLKEQDVSMFASTVITNQSLESIFEIAEWCLEQGVKKYYLYGLVKSGLGDAFIRKHGIPSRLQFNNIVESLRRKYSDTRLEIKCYDYSQNAECILVYGTGQVLVDPYFDSPTYQLEIGNILKHSISTIWRNFSRDARNLSGYKRHLLNAL